MGRERSFFGFLAALRFLRAALKVGAYLRPREQFTRIAFSWFLAALRFLRAALKVGAFLRPRE